MFYISQNLDKFDFSSYVFKDDCFGLYVFKNLIDFFLIESNEIRVIDEIHHILKIRED